MQPSTGATSTANDGAVPRKAGSRMRLRDVLGTGTLGLRARRTRTALSSVGIAIGIAAMVSVLGIAASSDAQLQADLDALGPDLLELSPSDSLTGDEVELPPASAAMIERIGPVRSAAAVSGVEATVRRSEFIPAGQTGGISVVAADGDVRGVLGITVADGKWLDAGTERLPNVLLGAVAAERLAVRSTVEAPQVYLSGVYFTVIGIADPVPLAPSIDRSAIIGEPIAEQLFGFERSPSRVFVRTGSHVPDDPELLDDVREIMAATVRPQAPAEVGVSRPSDLIAAREYTEAAFTGLLLGLGGVALLVGGVGIANVMVISVLERRAEIGLRRALGATRHHIAQQFLVESSLLAVLGGTGGVLIGSAITVFYARSQQWVIAVPTTALAGGIAATLAIGALAGIYPAIRASRTDPAQAVHPTV